MNQFPVNINESSRLTNKRVIINYYELRRPKLPFVSFCKSMLQINKQNCDNIALSTKELNNMWWKLPEINKKKYFDNYSLDKKEYERKKNYLIHINKEKAELTNNRNDENL